MSLPLSVSSNSPSAAAAPKQCSTCKSSFCVCMSMQWTSAHVLPVLLSLVSIRTLQVSSGQVGRGESLCSQQTIKQLVFLGCRHCAQNLGPQVGANLKQTCFNQKLKNNRKKKNPKPKNPSKKPTLPPTTKAISSDAGRKNEERAQYLPTPVARPILPLVSGLIDVCLFDFAPGWSNLLVLHVGAVVFALPCG